MATAGFIFTRDRTWILSDCPIVTEYNNAGASLAVSLYPVSYFASLFELLKTFRPDIPDFAIWLDFEINFSRFLFPFSHSSTTFSIFILFRNRKFWSPSSLLFLLPIQISKLRSFIFEPRNNRRSVRWIWVVIRVKNPWLAKSSKEERREKRVTAHTNFSQSICKFHSRFDVLEWRINGSYYWIGLFGEIRGK